jgi:Leucine-rich repeat (LRR) protein
MRKRHVISTVVFICFTFSLGLFGQAPTAVTGAAYRVSSSSVNLNGTVNANNNSSIVTFEYGTTTSYGSTITADESPVSGTSDTAVSGTVTSLTSGTTYHYRVVATNSFGTTNGADMTFTAVTGIPAIERAALVALYNSTDGDNWTINSNWKTPPLEIDGFAAYGSENTWHGINAASNSVTEIILNVNNLVGTIPPELGNLTNLQVFDLYINQLTGSIPTGLGSLVNLRILNLEANQLTGSIPIELGDLSNLQYLNLLNNQLEGSIPAELGNLSNLQTLQLDDNQLTGSIPTELGDLTNLQYLNLLNNQLEGSIPTGLGNLSNLQHLYLQGNQLTGSIPTELGNLTNLYTLYLSGNQLTESIPAELGNLSNLQELYLLNNQLTGSIPNELGNLSNLVFFFISGNALSGEIPTSLTNLTNLNFTDIGYNALYSTDVGLISFLNGKDPDWASTQTIAPTNPAPSATALTATSVRVNWTPILYSADPGGYIVSYGTAVGGPYTLFATRTADKTDAYLDVTGLAPGTQYYFVIQTHTDSHPNNQNALDSQYSQEVSAATPATITVTSPKKNDVYNARTIIHIQWDAPGLTGNVEIRLYLADESVNYLISNDQPVDTPLDYTVAENIAKGIYFIEVRQGTLFDRSGNFYIDNQSSVIEVTSPVGGETFNSGDTINIVWTTNRIIGDVGLTLIKSDDSSQFAITVGQPYDNSPFSYTIPAGVTAGSYYIKVEQGTVSGKSGDFTIN